MIEGWYISNRWGKSNRAAKRPEDDSVEFVPVFNPNRASYVEVEDRAPQPKQILVIRRHNPSSDYYPEPDYKGALTDIMIDSQIRQFKISKLRNDIGTNLIINIVGDLDEDQHSVIANDVVDQYQGSLNAGTPILTHSATAGEAHQFITPSNAKGNAETYNTYGEDAKQRILSAHGISREILDVDDSNSLFGDNKREKYQSS